MINDKWFNSPMRLTPTVVYVIVLTAAISVRADEIVLRDGKSLRGTITKEDSTEYTIRLGKNMFLRVEKTNVVGVSRTPRKEKGPILRLQTESPKNVTTSTTTARPKEESKLPLNIRTEQNTEIRRKSTVTIQETVTFKPYTVGGEDFKTINRQIFDSSTGEGAPSGKKREASSIACVFSWRAEPGREGSKYKWSSAVVKSTITVTVPFWEAPHKPSPETVKDWNEFISDVDRFERGRIKVYESVLDNFSESLAGLLADSEGELNANSQKLYTTTQERAQKRIEGYVRRKSKRVMPIKKR